MSACAEVQGDDKGLYKIGMNPSAGCCPGTGNVGGVDFLARQNNPFSILLSSTCSIAVGECMFCGDL